MTHLAKWFNQIELTDIDSFQILRRTFENHYQNIINFFDNRSTNAAAESFHAKVKDFRRQFRGIKMIGHSVLFGHPFRFYPDTF